MFVVMSLVMSFVISGMVGLLAYQFATGHVVPESIAWAAATIVWSGLTLFIASVERLAGSSLKGK